MKDGINVSYEKIVNVIPEIQTGLHWYVEFITGSGTVVSGLGDQDLIYQCSECEIPKEEHKSVSVEIGKHTINYVGKGGRNGSLAIKFVESVRGKMNQLINEFYEKVWQYNTGKQSLTKQVKIEIKIYVMSPDEKITRMYHLMGCIVTPSSSLSLNQSATAEEVTWTVDYDQFQRYVYPYNV